MSKENKTLHNKRKLIEALEKSLGVVTTACKMIGLSRTTYYEYYNEDKEFREACDSINDVVLDFAESQLHKQIKDGNTSATIFYLKTKGKHRGYIERIEQDNMGKQNITINVDKQSDLNIDDFLND